MSRAASMILCIFMIFPHVEEFEYFSAIELAFDLLYRALLNLLPGLFNEKNPGLCFIVPSAPYSNNIVCTGAACNDSGRRNVLGIGASSTASGNPALRRATSKSC